MFERLKAWLSIFERIREFVYFLSYLNLFKNFSTMVIKMLYQVMVKVCKNIITFFIY